MLQIILYHYCTTFIACWVICILINIFLLLQTLPVCYHHIILLYCNFIFCFRELFLHLVIAIYLYSSDVTFYLYLNSQQHAWWWNAYVISTCILLCVYHYHLSSAYVISHTVKSIFVMNIITFIINYIVIRTFITTILNLAVCVIDLLVIIMSVLTFNDNSQYIPLRTR